MEIRISLDQRDPPAGRIRVEEAIEPLPDHPGWRFSGWLGLLKALDELLRSKEPVSDAKN